MTLVVDRTGADNENHSDTADGGSPGYNETTIKQGKQNPRELFCGYLFLGADVSGTVDDATLTVEDVDFGSGDITTNISGDDSSGSPGTFSSGNSAADRTITTTTVVWDYASTGEEVEVSPDISAVVQELVNSYTTLTNLGIFVIGDGGTINQHDIESFNSDSTESPLLTLNYTAAAGGAPVGTLLMLGVGR